MPKTNQPLAYSQLVGDYQQAALRLALWERRQQEEEALLLAANSLSTADVAAIRDLANSAREKNMAGLRRAYLRQRGLRVLQKGLLQAARAAAAALILCCIAVTAVVASVESIRVQVFNLIFVPQKEYTEVSFQPDPQAAFEVPGEWQGQYYPAFIPPGYEVKKISCAATGDCSASYLDGQKRVMHFEESTADAMTNIDTEGAQVTYLTLFDRPALMAEEKGRILLTWSQQDRYFVLSLPGDAQLALKVAQSVQRIR